MLNAFLQGDVDQFFIEIGRFIVNTTTSLGFVDVASVNNKPLSLIPLKISASATRWQNGAFRKERILSFLFTDLPRSVKPSAPGLMCSATLSTIS